MSRILMDGVPRANTELHGITLKPQTASVASGALGYRISGDVKSIFDDDRQRQEAVPHVTLMQAETALQQLLSAGPTGVRKPTIRDVMEMDPMMLSMMMTQLVLNVSANNGSSICKQLERATEVQAELRNKQVAEYQKQINTAIEQSDQARKAGITNALFDWIIGGVEAIVGVLKMAEGVLTADPLAVADGAAYFSAGMAGMVKAGAETALLLGADKETCSEVIKDAGVVQNVCEGVALALDVMQIGRGISAARAVTKVTEEVLESGVGKQLVEAVAKGAEDELKVLAEKAGQEVSRVLGKDFGMAVEREMVEVGDMAIEAAAHELESEANMVRSIGKSFTREGVAKLVTAAIEDAAKGLLKKGEEVVAEKLRDAILQKLRRSIITTVIRDGTSKALLVTRATASGAEKISGAIIANRTAELQKIIEKLIVQQGLIDFTQNWTEDHKKTQQKQLNESYQNAADAINRGLDIINNSGTALESIAGSRA
ncbi:secretion system effector protein SseC [Yersinia aldovae]|uniref:type III secretion system translocon subunit SctE n=1 Tax=Yersinia aldovae TaxID=29483 RepID=UPI0005E9EB93|nr:type III secretion system translocon subunit SctE [Yersinia aldovae]CNJ53958.1 secretion system effector protein SseC [Yersinia aldovae]